MIGTLLRQAMLEYYDEELKKQLLNILIVKSMKLKENKKYLTESMMKK